MKRIPLHDAFWKDGRGWGADVLKALGLSASIFGDLHIVSIKPGGMRGNHYHPNGTEWIFLFGGPAKLAWKSHEGDPVQLFEVADTGGLSVFEIPSCTRHAVKNIGNTEIYLVAANDSREPGTVRCASLLESAAL